jgi:hypothetical protein
MKKSGQEISESKYQAIHKWLKRNFGKADRCENPFCLHRSKDFDWALLKGKEYEFIRENFMQLCRQCHIKYDEEFIKGKRNTWTNFNHTRKGGTLSKEHRKNIAKTINKNKHLYKKVDRFGSKNPKAKKVLVFSKNGDLIKTYDYAKQISKEFGINYSSLKVWLQKDKLIIQNNIYRYDKT